jgi:hypothetical protein
MAQEAGGLLDVGVLPMLVLVEGVDQVVPGLRQQTQAGGGVLDLNVGLGAFDLGGGVGR